jgi:hypothetical protein
MAEVIDTLVTDIVYRTDTKGIENARKLERDLEKQQDATKKSLEGLEKKQREATRTAESLALAQSTLRQQIALTAEEAEKLKDEQRELTREVERWGGPTREQAQRLHQISERLSELNGETSEYRRQLNRLGIDQARHRRTQIEIARETRELTQRHNELSRSTSQVRSNISKLSAALDKNKEKFKETARSAAGTVGALAGFAAAGGTAAIASFGAIGHKVIEVGTSFESLRARLKTVEGSTEGATAAFSLISDFTKRTPFELEQVTRAFTTLRVRGVDATAERLTALGDLSSAFGYTIEEMTDAIAAAARGELDPIEKFGIAGKIAGDKIALSFKGQKVEVDRSAAAVTEALVAFGKMEGVQGAMADQSTTAAGMISNLKDALSIFLDEVARSGVLDAFKRLLTELGSKFSEGSGFAKVLSDALVVIIDEITAFVASVDGEDIKSGLDTLYELAVSLADAIKEIVKMFEWFVEQSGSTGNALENLTLLAFGFVAALTGPAGILVAAGLVGAALGKMAAQGSVELQIMRAQLALINEEVAIAQERVDILENYKKDNLTGEKKFQEDMKAFETRAEKVIGMEVGGLGAGLLSDKKLTRNEKLQAEEDLRAGGRKAEGALDRLVSQEGAVVLEAVQKTGERNIAAAEARARKEAAKRGDDVEAAGRAARQAATESNRQSRKKALEVADKTFRQTGSAEAAAAAASGELGKVKGAAKGKKGGKGKAEKDDTLAHTIEKQLDDNAHKIAQMRAARALREGRVVLDDLKEYERNEYKTVREASGARYRETGQLPAGIAQSVRQISRVPNEADLAGRVAPPVISIQNNKYEITGNEFTVAVEGSFATTGQEVGRMALHELRRGLNLLLGEATPTPEKR